MCHIVDGYSEKIDSLKTEEKPHSQRYQGIDINIEWHVEDTHVVIFFC